MEEIKYGSRKGELEEKTSDYITITPEELSFLVRMRIVRSINVDVDVRAYDGGTDHIYPRCDTSKVLISMSQNRTFTQADINSLKKQGFSFETVTTQTI